MQLVFRAGIRSTEGRGKKSEAEDGAVVAQNKANKGKGKEFVEGSVDVVAMLDDQHFVSGGDSGSVTIGMATSFRIPDVCPRTAPSAFGIRVKRSQYSQSISPTGQSSTIRKRKEPLSSRDGSPHWRV